MISKKLYQFAFLIPFACFILGYIASNLLVGSTTYKTPLIIGLDIHEALKLTSQNHVCIEIVGEKESPSVTPGTILTQKPSAGRLIKPHQTILVTVAKTAMSKKAPNFVGTNIQQIIKLAKESNLKIKYVSIAHHAPTDTCIGQTPNAHNAITDNKITVYIAQQAPNLYIMPNLINMPLEQAMTILQQHHITPIIMYNYQKVNFTDFPDAVVKNQKPRAGSFFSIDQNTNIQLEITTD